MSAQYQQFSSAPTRKPRVDADGTVTFMDSNGDTVQMSNGNDIFHGLRHAGGEAFVESDSEEEQSHHAQPQYVAQPHYAYAPSVSSSSSKKHKKEKKEKKHKKERSPEYIAAPNGSHGNSSHACSCGNHRQ